MENLTCLILAAGKGTRMRSNLPKVMHAIAGQPMIAHVMQTVGKLAPAQVITVIAPDMEVVEKSAAAIFSQTEFAIQAEQKGTGHAVRIAVDKLSRNAEEVLVVYGDTPLLTEESLHLLLKTRRGHNAAIALSGLHLPDPTGYGRLVMEAEPYVTRIVECKDASVEEKKISWGWGGVMAFDAEFLRLHIGHLTRSTATGEFYLTELIGMAHAVGLKTVMVPMSVSESMGVNDRAQLAAAEAALQKRLREHHMQNGVTLVDPKTVFFATDTEIGTDTVVHPFVTFGRGVKIGGGVEIRSFSHIEQAEIGAKSIIGPYARLRPGAKLAEETHIGNFVEIKQTNVARGAKVNHLTYIGDAEIGEGANIGAGTITCNYDGVAKHKTVIGAHAFIGSNTSLVAPVIVGQGAITGAGSVITENVAAESLAIARGRQVMKEKPRKK